MSSVRVRVGYIGSVRVVYKLDDSNINMKYKIHSISDIQNEIDTLNIKKLGLNKTQEEELYLTLKFLLTDMKNIDLSFPYHIEVKDKPDIRIIKNNKTIGIEVRFILNQTLQKAKMIREQINSNFLIEPSLYRENKSRKDIEESIIKSNSKLTGSAYLGDELEQEIAELVILSIKEKVKKYKGYEIFEENYLILYSDRLIADKETIMKIVNEKLTLISNIPFDKIIFRIQGMNYYFSY